MFLVGGGILAHGLPGLHDLAHAIGHRAAACRLGGVLGIADASPARRLVGRCGPAR